MSDINVVYKGSSIATMDATGNKTIETGGKYCEDDITIEYTRPSGGGGVAENAVNFIDYDGTIVQSYSAADFANLSAMPENPSHAGLTAQGWNWELSDAKTYVAKYGLLDIGQMYITDDGKTRIYIHLEEGRTSPVLGVGVDGTVDVDWGDNTAHDTLTGSSASTIQWTSNHEYSAPGDYVIKLTATGSADRISLIGVQSDTDGSAILRAQSNSSVTTRAYHKSIRKVEIGSKTGLGVYAFYQCIALETITIPRSISFGSNAIFYNCYNLKSVTIPNGVTALKLNSFRDCRALLNVAFSNSIQTIGDTVFQNDYSLKRIIIPEDLYSIGKNAFKNCTDLKSAIIPGVSEIKDNAFDSCYSLISIVIPGTLRSFGTGLFQYCYDLENVTILDGVTSIGSYAFAYDNNLTNLIIPEGVTSIGSSAFYYCNTVLKITIPESVTSIGTDAFKYCGGVKEYHILSITPPTLASATVFNNRASDCVFYVPAGSLETYQTASNWSNLADLMVEEQA